VFAAISASWRASRSFSGLFAQPYGVADCTNQVFPANDPARTACKQRRRSHEARPRMNAPEWRMTKAKWTADDIPDQTGRIVVVTGATVVSACAPVRHSPPKGPRSLMACRDQARRRSPSTGQGGRHRRPPEVVALDLADLASVQRAAEKSTQGRPPRRAGEQRRGHGVPRRETADGFEMQPDQSSWPLRVDRPPDGAIQRSDAPRVVTVSSNGHRMGRMKWDDMMWEHGRTISG